MIVVIINFFSNLNRITPLRCIFTRINFSVDEC
uniref:Uncharacterized protein n=1 Tax=Arundo donax TaxID=35708 RepID=A0A0A9G259_ARUDO